MSSLAFCIKKHEVKTVWPVSLDSEVDEVLVWSGKTGLNFLICRKSWEADEEKWPWVHSFLLKLPTIPLDLLASI